MIDGEEPVVAKGMVEAISVEAIMLVSVWLMCHKVWEYDCRC